MYLLQFEFGFAVLLLSPVVCSIMAFIRSLQGEETPLTPKPRRVHCSSQVCNGYSYMKLQFGFRLNLIANMSISLILFVSIILYYKEVYFENFFCDFSRFLMWHFAIYCLQNAG